MCLRLIAESDLQNILEDKVSGFGWDVTLTDPSGTTSQLTGFSNDISQVIDPETGQVVSGRSASVSLRVASIFAAGFNSLPVGIADASSKPWKVQFNDLNGNIHNFKIIQSNPDRTLGIVTCLLGAYV